MNAHPSVVTVSAVILVCAVVLAAIAITIRRIRKQKEFEATRKAARANRSRAVTPAKEDLVDKQLRHNIAVSVRTTMSTYIMYWHKLCLEVSVLVSSGILAVSTLGVEKSALTDAGKACLVAGFGLAALAAVWLIYEMSDLLDVVRRILVKADKVNHLFVKGAFVSGDSLYPPEWEVLDAVKMGVVPRWGIGVVLATWAVASFMLLL
jgi:hypothetical protein